MRHLSLTLAAIVCCVLAVSPAVAGKAGPGGKPAGGPNAGHNKPANHAAAHHKPPQQDGPGRGDAADHKQKQRPGDGNNPDVHKSAKAAHERLVKKFDANGDGKLERSEREAAKQAIQEHSEKGGGEKDALREKLLKHFDANHDGQLDPKERAAAREAWERHQKQDGNWPPDPRKDELLKRFDADGDGKLSPAEREKAQAALEARRQKERAAAGDQSNNAKGHDKDRQGPKEMHAGQGDHHKPHSARPHKPQPDKSNYVAKAGKK